MTPLVLLIGLALLFDVANGFHDSANSVATVVSTRVLSPGAAVAWAAFFNFVAFLVFKTKVASSIADGVHREYITLGLVGAAVAGAVIWDVITWVAALPTSSCFLRIHSTTFKIQRRSRRWSSTAAFSIAPRSITCSRKWKPRRRHRSDTAHATLHYDPDIRNTSN